MKLPLRRSRSLWVALVVAALALAAAAPVLAQSVTIIHPTTGPGDMCGVHLIESELTTAPPGFTWVRVSIRVSDSANPPHVEIGNATILPGATRAAYECVSSAHANGACEIKATGYLRNDSTGQETAYESATLSDEVQNPCAARQTTRDQLRCSCARDCVSTHSETSPRSGAQSFRVPVVSWDFKGESYEFALTYTTHALFDPQTPIAGFSGVGERNSYGQGGTRWSHNFDQWIDLFQDENGVLYAVWHMGSTAISFKKTDTGWDSEESYLTLESGGGPVTSPPYPNNGLTQTLQVAYGWFKIKDGDGTEYHFNYQPPSGQRHLHWLTSEATALPHYLLTRVRDRWGRTVSLAWSSGGAPRVTRVWTGIRDGFGPGVRLYYKQSLLTGVSDDFGHLHSLTYSPVPDERNINRQQLTQVRALGPGSVSNPPHWIWSFVYRDASNPGQAYGNAYTGDLVIQKTEPDGAITKYRHEAVALAGPGLERLRGEDWEGRVTRIALVDSEATGGERVIERIKVSATQFKLRYPGGPEVQYTYSGEDVTEVKDLATNRAWKYAFDTRHNLTEVRTPVEATGEPLVRYTHTLTSAGRITQTVAQVRQQNGSLGDPVTVELNTLNQPTRITETARPGHSTQITEFQYDSLGNLKKVIEAVGLALQQETNLAYAFPDGAWGLPTSVTGPEGATSTFDYHNDRGWLITARSPYNLVAGAGHPDYEPSVTTLAYNDWGLPILVRDPENHQISISYAAAAPFSPNMVITLTYPDGNTARATLDPYGRVLIARDENGVETRWTYTPAGAVNTVTRAYGTVDQTVIQFFYNDHGDLWKIVAPKGNEFRFEYTRYNESGQPVGTTYEGQVTRILYPDNTSEFFGYYRTSPSRDAGELEWVRKRDGTLIQFRERDALHRVTAIDYPTSTHPITGQTIPGFTVTARYDEFGRLDLTTDLAATTTLAYDDLNRLQSLTSTGHQKALTVQYQRDLTYQRWITTVSVAGVGDYVYREDTKGRLAQVVNPAAQTFTLEHDKDGKNTVVHFPNGVKEVRGYNNRDWLATLELRPAGWMPGQQPTDRFTYLYGAAGNLLSETDLGNRVHAFVYDYLYRVKSETHPDLGTNGIQYTYDPNGNRLTRTQSGATDYYGVHATMDKLEWVNRAGNFAPTPGQTNAPYTLLTYDGNGRLVRRDRGFGGGSRQVLDLRWDGDDRLCQVDQSGLGVWTAQYDGDGLRTFKSDVWTGDHQYSWGPGGVLHDSNGGTAITFTPGFAHREGSTAAGDRFYHGDWLGSTRYLSGSSGTSFPAARRYDGFGNWSVWSGGGKPQSGRGGLWSAAWSAALDFRAGPTPHSSRPAGRQYCGSIRRRGDIQSGAPRRTPKLAALLFERYSGVPYAGLRRNTAISGRQRKRRDQWLARPRQVYMRVSPMRDQPEA